MDINGFQILKVLPKVKTMTLKIKMSETLPHNSQSRKHSTELSIGDISKTHTFSSCGASMNLFDNGKAV